MQNDGTRNVRIKAEDHPLKGLTIPFGIAPNIELSPGFRRRTVLLAGLYIFCFYGIFQPFQMRFYPLLDKTIVLGAFSLIGTGVLFLNFFMLYPRFRKTTFSRNRPLHAKILWSFWNLYSVGLAFFVFKSAYGFYDPSFARLTTGALSGLAIGAPPIVIYLFAVYIMGLHAAEPEPVPEAGEIVIKAERGEQEIRFQIKQFLYAESRGNYVHFFLLSPSGLREVRLRCTLKSVKEQLRKVREIEQVHRAFLVNLARVSSFREEGRKKQVYLEACPRAVPVSPSYSLPGKG